MSEENSGISPEVELEIDGVEVNPTLEVDAGELDVNPTLEMEMQVEMGGRSSELNAEAWAVGERAGVPVGSTDQTYHNNSKYYAQQAGGSATAAEAAQTAAEAAAEHYPYVDSTTGNWMVFDTQTAAYVDTGVHAQGSPGTPGVSPTVTVTDITGGHRVTITDGSGSHTYDVMDGQDGQDGVSPTVSVTTITGGHEVSITDAGGTDTFDVMDGQDGAPGRGVPSGGSTGKFCKKKSDADYDTEWDDPPYPSTMTGADASTAGTAGLVPAPAAGDQAKVLKGDGTWANEQDISGKADKASGATAGNFAGLVSGGNIADSNVKPADFFYIESSASTASRAYSKGDYILVNGTFSQATADISAGGSFTPVNLIPAQAALNGIMAAVVTNQENIAKAKADIGYVEDTNTATHAISKGQYVIWNGDLYKASAAIAIGTTLSSSNLTAVSGGIGAEVASLNSHKANYLEGTFTTKSQPQTDGATYTTTEAGLYMLYLSADNANAYFEINSQRVLEGNSSTRMFAYLPLKSGVTITHRGSGYADVKLIT